MKAIICTKSGPPEVLQLQDVKKPIPTENEVLIKVHAATVTQGDVMLRKLHPLLYSPHAAVWREEGKRYRGTSSPGKSRS